MGGDGSAGVSGSAQDPERDAGTEMRDAGCGMRDPRRERDAAGIQSGVIPGRQAGPRPNRFRFRFVPGADWEQRSPTTGGGAGPVAQREPSKGVSPGGWSGKAYRSGSGGPALFAARVALGGVYLGGGAAPGWHIKKASSPPLFWEKPTTRGGLFSHPPTRGG